MTSKEFFNHLDNMRLYGFITKYYKRSDNVELYEIIAVVEGCEQIVELWTSIRNDEWVKAKWL